MVDTAVRADAAAELAELVAAVYAGHEGLVERVLAFERAAAEAGDERHELLGRLIRADLDNRNGRGADGVRTAYELLDTSSDRIVVASVTHARFAVDEGRRNSEHFRELAERDPLTGLWNRRRCDDHLPALLEVPAPFCVAILDLDHFKQINDTYSHAVGDDVLRQVASLLEPFGHAGRHGGEEFVLYLDADGPAAARLCERLRRVIAGHAWSDLAPGLQVTTSVGVTARRAGDDGRSVMARADSYLYAAKNAGRNRVTAD